MRALSRRIMARWNTGTYRRALPARSDVGAAQVIDYGNAEPCGERGTVAELNSYSAVGLAGPSGHGSR